MMAIALAGCAKPSPERSPGTQAPGAPSTTRLSPAPPPAPPPANTGSGYVHPLFRFGPPRTERDIVREPAVRARVLKTVPPKYTTVALKARIRGTVIVEVVVETDGRASAAEVLKPLPFGLDQSAVECVRQWRFAPAKDRGRTVRSVYRATVKFELPE